MTHRNGGHEFINKLTMPRRRFLIGGLGVGGSLVVAGVLTGRDGEASASGRSQPAAGRSGGELRVGVPGIVPPTFGLGFSAGGQDAVYHAFAWPLYHGSYSDDIEPTPALAASYSVGEDGRTHAFVLRRGATFHDGSPMTAEAVAEVLRSMTFSDHPLRDEGSYAYHFAGFGSPTIVESIDATDELTIEYRLSSPRADIRQSLTQHHIFNPAIMSRPEYGTDPGALRDIGSGPFRVSAFESSAFVEFERYDGFFTDVLLDRLRFENFTDSAAMALALRSGDIDAAFAMRKADHDTVAAEAEFQATVYEPSFNVFFRFNPENNEALQDVRVREAVALGMNRPAYRDAFFSAETAKASSQGILHPDRRGYNDEIEEPPYDPDRARDLLAEAGAEGFTLKLTTYPSGTHVPEAAALCEVVQADLTAIGINVELNSTDYASWAGTLYDHDLWISSYAPETSSFVMTLINTASSQLGGEWPSTDPRSDPAVEERTAEGVEAFDLGEQARIFEDLQLFYHDETRLIIPLAQVDSSIISRVEVHDLIISTLGPGYESAWVETA